MLNSNTSPQFHINSNLLPRVTCVIKLRPWCFGEEIVSRIIGKPSPLPIMLGDGYKIISERDSVSDVFVVSLSWFPSSFCLLSENG